VAKAIFGVSKRLVSPYKTFKIVHIKAAVIYPFLHVSLSPKRRSSVNDYKRLDDDLTLMTSHFDEDFKQGVTWKSTWDWTRTTYDWARDFR
jgi:hypothetical protein